MDIVQNMSLKNLNTFGIESRAKFFAEVTSAQDVQELVTNDIFKNNVQLILGGGSNILFTKDFDGLIIKNSILGKEILRETDKMIQIKIGSGENWHNTVLWTTDSGWSGIENLALIPGLVGAAPVQNIGAYGVEIKDVLQKVGVVDLVTGEAFEILKDDCKFGYRDSIFKQESKGKYFITYIILELSKEFEPNIEYGSIQGQLDKMSVTEPTLVNVRDAVTAIRQSKLPDPREIGNAGSFFKNPIVSFTDFQEIREQYSDIPNFLTDDGVKIPAGWLIEQCGWKGRRVGNVGVHEKQALVLVNHGGATGQEIKELSQSIQTSVKERFDIDLETEVTMI